MKTLYLRNVPDDVIQRLEVLADVAGTSVSATAIRELADVTRRADNAVLLGALPDAGISRVDILSDLEAVRSDR